MFNSGVKEKINNLEIEHSRLQRELRAEREIRKFLTRGDFSLNVFFEKFAYFHVKEVQEVLEIVFKENNIKSAAVDFGLSRHYSIRVRGNRDVAISPMQLIKHVKNELMREFGNIEDIFKAEAPQGDA